MNADNSQLLAQLQDIHSAGDPGWWPPAPGWWLLAVLILLGIVLALRSLINRLVLLRRRRAWLRALESLQREHDPADSPHEYLAAINRLFRAVALKAFPATACARLQGEDWVDFIVSLSPEQATNESLSVLAHGPYERLPEFDAQALDAQARTWVNLYG